MIYFSRIVAAKRHEGGVSLSGHHSCFRPGTLSLNLETVLSVSTSLIITLSTKECRQRRKERQENTEWN
jgi:hypothetical protein